MRPRIATPFALLGLAGLLVGCASGPPPRYVVERDLGPWSYRRYQKTLDVELPVRGDPAVGHIASYVLHGGSGPEVRVATAFVTVYEKPRGLAAEVKERLDGLASYDVAVEKVDGEWVFRLDGGADRWLLWVSGNRVVKVGSQSGPVPDDVSARYLDIYPSDLDAYGRAREGTPSAGKSHAQLEESESEGPPMPSNLREGAPR